MTPASLAIGFRHCVLFVAVPLEYGPLLPSFRAPSCRTWQYWRCKTLWRVSVFDSFRMHKYVSVVTQLVSTGVTRHLWLCTVSLWAIAQFKIVYEREGGAEGVMEKAVAATETF